MYLNLTTRYPVDEQAKSPFHVGKLTKSDIFSTSSYISVLNLGVITPTKTTIDGKTPLKYKQYIGANKNLLQVSGFSCEQRSFLLPPYSSGDSFGA